jgi:hypothetical protein
MLALFLKHLYITVPQTFNSIKINNTHFYDNRSEKTFSKKPRFELFLVLHESGMRQTNGLFFVFQFFNEAKALYIQKAK